MMITRLLLTSSVLSTAAEQGTLPNNVTLGLQRFEWRSSSQSAAPVPQRAPQQKPSLPPLIAQPADAATYGTSRRGYLKAVAEAGDAGAPIDELTAQHFGGSSAAYGGTHYQIERRWRSLGGSAWAPQLITDKVDDAGERRQVMLPEARQWAVMYDDLKDIAEDLA